jgi:hypothetical protein
MPVKSLENLLNSNDDGQLGDIVKRAQGMGELVQHLQQAIPGKTGSSIVAANVRDDGELVILANSSAWAAKLRFEAETLMEAARQNGHQVRSCKVRVSHGN